MLSLLTLLLSLGLGPIEAQDMSEAMKLMQVSCDKSGQPKACFNLANMYLNAKNQAEAEKYFQKACRMEYRPACKKEVWKKPVVKKKNDEGKKRSYLNQQCKPLFGAILDCKEFTCEQPNLLSPDTMVIHKVTGNNLNGFCKYSYTLNKERQMVCMLDASARKNFRDRSEGEALEVISDYQRSGICNERAID